MPTQPQRHTWYHKIALFQGVVIDEVTGENIAVTYAQPHAEQIAREHNSHAALLEALQGNVNYIYNAIQFMQDNGLGDTIECKDLRRQEKIARAAIAAATGEGN